MARQVQVKRFTMNYKIPNALKVGLIKYLQYIFVLLYKVWCDCDDSRSSGVVVCLCDRKTRVVRGSYLQNMLI